MIGVFDSGYGGLTVLKALIECLPDYGYVYLGDNARAPYGSRPEEEIFAFTLEGVSFLFDQGCPLVILACNTSSANALRRIQQEVLPKRWPDRRVLGILVPTVEQIARGSVVVFGTEATVRSHAYAHEIAKRRPGVEIVEAACPQIVPLIESGADEDALEQAVKKCVASSETTPDAAVLGCTHFTLVKHLFEQAMPGIPIFDQPAAVAQSLEEYLGRHPDIESMIDRSGQRVFITTGDPGVVSELATRFFGKPLSFTQAQLQD